jgi:hypothetical protein
MYFVKKHFLILFGLVAIVFFVYTNSLGNAFVSDDTSIRLLQNTDIWQFLRLAPWKLITPVQYYTYLHLFGELPWIYRLTNIINHIGVVWLVYFIGSIHFNKKVGIFSATLFAVHPILIESITWVSGGIYAKYTFFLLISFYSYIRSYKSNKWYFVSIITFILSIWTSEKAMIFPIVIFIYELSLGDIKSNWKNIIPFFILNLLWVYIYAIQIPEREASTQILSNEKREIINPLYQIPIAISSYLWLMVWPDKLALYHSEMMFTASEFVRYLLGFCVFCGVLIFSWVKDRRIFFWLSFFIISLLPTLLPFGWSWIVAERYVYAGTAGIMFCAGYVFFKAYEKETYRSLVILIFIGLIIGLSIRTIIRNTDWKNEDTLWVSMIRTSPTSYQNYNNLGDMYGRHGQLDKSIQAFEYAVKLYPQYADALHNLGAAYLKAGRVEDAFNSFSTAIQNNPNLWQSYQNRSALLYAAGKYKEALMDVENALRINPKNEQLIKAKAEIIKKMK